MVKQALLLLFVVAPLMATDTVNFMDLAVTVKEDELHLKVFPQKLLDYELTRNDAYNINKNTVELVFDAPLRQTAFLIRTLERNRGTIMAANQSLMVLEFEVELVVRADTGEPITERIYKVSVGLDSEPGKGIIQGPGIPSYKFDINKLDETESYQDFVTHLAFPFEEMSLPKPPNSMFLVDLYYNWPDLVVDEKQVRVFDLFPSWLTWDRGIIKKVKIHLGSTFCFQKDGEWKQVRNTYARLIKDAIEEFGQVLEFTKQGDLWNIIPALEKYVDKSPGDRKALKLLMDYYLEDQRSAEAYNLITRFQPLFATIRGGLPNKRALAEKAERRRNWLLGEKAGFEKNESVNLKITQPIANDLVTGTTDLAFTLAGNESPILEVECYFDEQLIAKLKEPPFKVPFTVDGAYGRKDLRVVAYFEDETYQEDIVRVATMKVDEEQSVQLVGVRASVLQKGDGRELDMKDFVIKENGKTKELNSFRKDSAPLRVAILIDTSISMVGKKLHRAQYAVKTFLSKMAPEDRVSIYTFDDHVLKLSDFTNDYDDLSGKVMTLGMQAGTSLYDAMLLSHDALLGQNGTKVMIVLSDGDDASSATTDLHVARVIQNSPVMVYSVILPGGIFPNSDEGKTFLKEMANVSGSLSINLRNVDNLSVTFDRLYEDLKSFYYMDYYSRLRRENREIDIRLKGARGKIRSREL